MRKIKKLGLIMTVIMGTLIFAACGGSSANPGDVADKFMNGMFKENLSTEESRKEIKDLMHSSYTDEDKNDILDEYSITGLANNLFTRSEIEEMKEMGIDGKMNDLVDAMRKAIKIERLDVKDEGETAVVKYKVSMPKIDEDKAEEEMKKIADKIQKDIIDGKVELDAGLKDVMVKAMDIYLNQLKSGTEFDEEEGEVELKKADGKWLISDVI
ncbi:MAG: hypothetical protein ACRC28_07915 [Clostridium sp.]|uniref:hypothetical protein n=1 Tax=Clostridium sp. TaxID=1506 RepID=UPI003F3B7C42